MWRSRMSSVASCNAAREAEVIAALTALVTKMPQWGFWMCFDALRLAGHPWNWKRVYRVYKALRLNLKRRRKRRVPPREGQPLDAPAVLNGIWALDFMSDTLYSGTRFRTANASAGAIARKSWTRTFSACSTTSASRPSAGSRSTTRGGRTTASAGSRRSPSCRGHPRRPSPASNGLPEGEADVGSMYCCTEQSSIGQPAGLGGAIPSGHGSLE